MPHSRAASGGRGQGQALQARRTAHTTHVVRNWRPAGRCGYVPARVSTHGITKAHLGLPARHRKVSWLLGFSSACSRRRAHAWRSVWMTTAAGSDDRRKGQGRAVRGRGARPPLAGQGLSETATCDRPAATLAAHQPHKGALPTGAATLDQGLAHSAVPLPIHALAKPNRGAQRAVAARLRCRAPPAHSPPPRLVSPPVNQPAAPCPQTKPPPMLLHVSLILGRCFGL